MQRRKAQTKGAGRAGCGSDGCGCTSGRGIGRRMRCDIHRSPTTQHSGRLTAAAYVACEGAKLREDKHVHLRQSSRACPTRHRLTSALPRRRVPEPGGPTPRLQIGITTPLCAPRYSFHSSCCYSCALAMLLCCDCATLYCLCRSPPSDRRVQGEHDGHRWIQHAQGSEGQG